MDFRVDPAPSFFLYIIFERWVNTEVANLISSSTIKEICIAVQPQKYFPTELATRRKSSSQELNFLLEDHEAFCKLSKDTARLFWHVFTCPSMSVKLLEAEQIHNNLYSHQVLKEQLPNSAK